jgi:hypothetical protein
MAWRRFIRRTLTVHGLKARGNPKFNFERLTPRLMDLIPADIENLTAGYPYAKVIA